MTTVQIRNKTDFKFVYLLMCTVVDASGMINRNVRASREVSRAQNKLLRERFEHILIHTYGRHPLKADGLIQRGHLQQG
jgi:hypothetical protein